MNEIHKICIAATILWSLTVSIANASETNVVSPQPGILHSLIEQPEQVESLSVTGTIDASDIYFMSEAMTSLKNLDLGGATIAAYSGKPLRPSNSGTHPAHTIPPYAFVGSQVTEIKLPDNTQTIGYGAMAGCPITNITIPENVTTIADEAFSSSALTEITIPASVQTIGNGSFRKCAGLSSVKIGGTSSALSNIGSNTFECTGLTAIDLSECRGLRNIGDWAFASAPQLTTVILPTTVRSIGKGAFMNDKQLSAITLSNELGNIPAVMLYGAQSLQSVKIPAATDSIGTHAMAGMKTLASVDASATRTVPELEPDVWTGTPTHTAMLYVPERLYNQYLTSPQWQEFKIEGVSGIDAITNNAAEQLNVTCDGTLIHIEAPAELKSIKLMDCAGHTISIQQPNSTTHNMDIGRLPHSVYLLQCLFGNSNKAVVKISI